MKTKYGFLSMFFAIIMTLPIFGQPLEVMNADPIVNGNNIASVMGKPVFELTVDSLNTKVWILTQRQYKKIMKTPIGEKMGKMKGSNMKMDKATKEAVMAGTNYFIFDVTNITNGKEFADTSAKVEIVSPSRKVSSINLQSMMNHFGSGVSLEEKGEYLFTINLNIGTGYKTTQFKYKVK